MKRRAGEPKIIARERREFECIGCGFFMGVNWSCEEGNDLEEWKKNVQEGLPLPVGLGWRKVEGGWKCGDCTGIPGQVGKALKTIKGTPTRAVMTFDDDGKLTKIWGERKGGRKKGR